MQVLLWLWSRHPEQPVPTTRRTHTRHGHPLWLCRTHRISHAYGELNKHFLMLMVNSTNTSSLLTFISKVTAKTRSWISVSSHNQRPHFSTKVSSLFLPTLTANKNANWTTAIVLFIHLYIVTVLRKPRRTMQEWGGKSGISFCVL